MKKGKLAARSLLLISLLLAVGGLFPSQTFAAEVVVRTNQVIPQGSNNCPQLPVSSFAPFVYDSALHSFEFYVADASYVALIGTAGSNSVPFNQMTRRVDNTGRLRIHVDLSTSPINGTMPVSVTLLSSKGPGQPVCITTVSTTVGSADTVTSIPQPTQPSGSASGNTGSGTTPSNTSGAGKGSTSTATSVPPVVGSTGGVGAGACVSETGASSLWLVLLALYALVAGVAASGQLQIPGNRRIEWIAAAIVVPFLLLFGIWYFVPSCRAGIWAPIIAILIALAALGAAYWREKQATQVITLPAARSK